MKRKIVSMIVCLMLILPMAVYPVFAENGDMSITIDYKYEKNPVKGVTFNVYKIADVNENMKFTVTDKYKDYPVSLKAKTTDEWMTLADTYRAYVVVKGYAPDAAGTTGADGKVKIKVPADGMYLVVGEKTTADGYTYVIRPSLVSVPDLDPADPTEQTRFYNVTVAPKSTRERNKQPGEVTHRIVQKIWVDEAEKPEHPEELLVSLYCDDKLYETVKLNEKNNWLHIWTNLPAGDENGAAINWVISEQPVKGYSLKIDMTQKNIFVITNTDSSISPPGPGPDDTTSDDTTVPGGDDTTTPPDDTTAPGEDDTTVPGGDEDDTTAPGEDETTAPTGEDTTAPDETGGEDTTKNNPDNKEETTAHGEKTPENEKPVLPQTGQLWWPVPVLLVLGTVLIIIGIVVSGKKKHTDKE